MVSHRQNVQQLRDGSVEIYVRSDVKKPIWQACMPNPEGGRALTQSLKTTVQAEAVRAAEEWFDEVRFRLKHGMVVQPRTVANVCDLYIKDLKEEVASGVTNARHLKDYEPLVERYVKGYFGPRHVDSLKLKDVEAFRVWCRDYWTTGPGLQERNKVYKRNGQRIVAPTKAPKPLSASAIGKILVVLRSVFRTAVKYEAIREANVPPIKEGGRKAGTKAQNRAAFDIKEYRKLYRFLMHWHRKAETQDQRERRLLLWDYVIVLVNSGVRPGTESDRLCWKHVDRFIDAADGLEYVRLWLNGKTGERQAIVMPRAGIALDRIRKRRIAVLGNDPSPDEPVFALPDGTPIKEDYLRSLFKNALTAAGLLKDAMGRARSLYSCRHTYATFRILYGQVNVFVLAENMGTSVPMIKKHYSHLTPTMARVELTQIVKRHGKGSPATPQPPAALPPAQAGEKTAA